MVVGMRATASESNASVQNGGLPGGLEPARLAEGSLGVFDERLTLQSFMQLAGRLGGYPYVKLVIDRELKRIHVLRATDYEFHADYIAEKILGVPREVMEKDIDAYNQRFYHAPAETRRFLLGILALHQRDEKRFFTLESVEVDTMDRNLLREFFATVKRFLEASIPLLLKPANHQQELFMTEIPTGEMPRVFAHELFASARFIPLNPGTARGRIRAFRTEAEYRASVATLEWHDILVMHRVPEDLPRVSGILNAHHTTPLSHTNVLASGWGIPNCIQLGIFEQIDKEGLNGRWVEYGVEMNADAPRLQLIPTPLPEQISRPAWSVQKVQIEEPEVANTPILSLEELRLSDRSKYGTKAANLGELGHVLRQGSSRLLGFYRVPRPPRANLLPYLAKALGLPEGTERALDRDPRIAESAREFLGANMAIPRGIAIPFAVQQEFLESSPRIQQMIGKLKMALELNVREVDALCVSLQQLIRSTRLAPSIRSRIDDEIAHHLSGVSSFVIRSSSNAEDLENFSAAGIYESINQVATAEKIFEGIKEVWASLLSPRSVRLRQQVGISLDASYMGVIVQEEVASRFGGVLVTTNPLNKADFRNVYVNVSPAGVTSIVSGSDLPIQYLYNTVEGGGRTISMGDSEQDLPESDLALLQKLAFAGRLLQSHFSPDYRFSHPVDIEWLVNDEGLWIVQIRPYAKS